MNNITEMIILLPAVFAAVFGAGAAWHYRRREKRTLQKLNRMLDAAIDGDFRESDFDESLLSSVESKLSQYLLASAVSARNLSEEKNKIKTLIGDISHQTRTPLANILLYTELLAERETGENRAYVEALENQTRKLQFLIAALVKTSRLETGILAFHPKREELFPMLSRAVAAYGEKASEKGISLELEPGEAWAVFDPKWTEEAVCNLLDNAVKYTPTGGRVLVRAQAYDLFSRIDVIDNGTGIEESIQPKVFARFFRGETAAEQEGVGIGLYLVRQIAAGQGGYVKVSSQPGKGAVFSLFLPGG